MTDQHFIDLIDGWRYRFLAGEFAFVGGEAPPLETLQRLLCEALAKLNRWGGWSKEAVSVAQHTLLVCAFTLARAEGLGWSKEKINAAVREAAAHDLHEPLGLGDVLSPVLQYLRPFDGTGDPRLLLLVVKGKIAVRQLFGLPEAGPEIARIVKLADHDAAAVERGYAFGDAPDWLGPRVELARLAAGKHNYGGEYGSRVRDVLVDGTEAMIVETKADYLLRRLGFETMEGRARLVELSGVPS